MYSNNQKAFAAPGMPCNPLPFLIELTDLIRKNGTDYIKSDAAKMLLLTVNMQAYGQLSTIDTCDEWNRLKDVIQQQ